MIGLGKRKYKKYQKDIADNRFTNLINDLIELKKQYQVFLDNDEVMELKRKLRYYKGRSDMYKKQYLTLKSCFRKRWGKNYYVMNGVIKKYEVEP